MKKRVLTTSLLAAVITGSLVFPASSSAFWPFDAIFGKGEVKGEQTDPKPAKSVRNFFTKTTPTPTVVKEDKEIDEEINEKKIEELSKGKIISEAQRKEMLAKLKVIRARKAELKRLRDAFKQWLKENNINPQDLIDPTDTVTVSVTPTKKVEPTITRYPTKPRQSITPTRYDTPKEILED